MIFLAILGDNSLMFFLLELQIGISGSFTCNVIRYQKEILSFLCVSKQTTESAIFERMDSEFQVLLF